MKAFVTGSTGLLGNNLVRQLLAEGHEVVGLTRSAEKFDRMLGDTAATPIVSLMLRAMREGYQVLRANGVPITPGNHRVFEWLPESLLLFLMRRMVKAETAAIKLGHAEQGRAEWQLLADEFRSLIERVDVPTPSIDVAYRNLSPAAAAAE